MHTDLHLKTCSMNTTSETVLVVAAALQRPGPEGKEFLIVRRGPQQAGAGFWEFPGGKVEPGEETTAALVREIQEELGVVIQVGDFVGENLFRYPTKQIRLLLFECQILQGTIQLTEHDALQWLRAEEIPTADLSEADRPFVPVLQGKR